MGSVVREDDSGWRICDSTCHLCHRHERRGDDESFGHTAGRLRSDRDESKSVLFGSTAITGAQSSKQYSDELRRRLAGNARGLCGFNL